MYASARLGKSLDDLADELQGYVAARFKAVKIRDRDLAVAPVKRSREAVGADVRLIVDTNQSFIPRPAKFAEALRYARRIAEYDVMFLEEPLAVDDTVGYARMVERAPMPISGGETLNSAANFRHYVDTGAFDIVQPDAARRRHRRMLEVLEYAEGEGTRRRLSRLCWAACQARERPRRVRRRCRMIEWATPPTTLARSCSSAVGLLTGVCRSDAAGLGIELTEE